jgi:hypothetical protein
MSVTSKDHKISGRTITKVKTHAVMKASVGNYEKHPFFVKKANEVSALIERVGLPESFKTKVG